MQVVSQFSLPFSVSKPSSRPIAAPRPAVHAIAAPPAHRESEKTSAIWETGSFSFRDIIDAINPLQHIPIISTIYRKLTGDQMGYAARIAGDTLFGGVFGSFISGAISAIANVFIDALTGKDIGEHVMAVVEPATEPSTSPTIYANKQPARQIPIPPQPQQPSKQQTILADQLMSPNQAGTAPLNGVSKAQAAIDQYKGQTLANEAKHHSNYWG